MHLFVDSNDAHELPNESISIEKNTSKIEGNLNLVQWKIIIESHAHTIHTCIRKSIMKYMY